MKHYVAYRDTTKEEELDEGEILDDVVERLEADGCKGVVFEYDVAPNNLDIDGHIVHTEFFLENERLVREIS